MFVRYHWITVKRVHFQYEPHWSRKVTKWRGLFLFGILPLAIWCVEYTYEG